MHFSCCLLSKRNQQVAKKRCGRAHRCYFYILARAFHLSSNDWIGDSKNKLDLQSAFQYFFTTTDLLRKKTCFALLLLLYLRAREPLIYTLETPVVGSTSNTASLAVEKLLC